MSSKRLPGKMLMNIGEVPLYQYVYRRCQQVRGADSVILATSADQTDDSLANSAEFKGFNIFRGSLSNVLGRYIACAQEAGADAIIRVCGDSPFVDVGKAEQLLTSLYERELEYIGIRNNRCVKGLDSEAIRLSALQKSLELNDHPDNLEHVTHFIRHNFQIFRADWLDIDLDPFGGRFSLTVDTAKDLKFCQRVATAMSMEIGSEKFDFTSDDVFSVIRKLFCAHEEKGKAYAGLSIS
jgi:spore coat polysaccharide biosynthesis protein SpsF (cytidylyltransferase family)